MKTSKLTELAKIHSGLNLGLLSKNSVDWLKLNVGKLRNPKAISNGIVQELGRPIKRLEKGKLYFYNYDPKHKDTLEYYDIFPLVLVLEKYNDGFLGLNLHYLPINLRAIFLDQLSEFAKLNSDGDIRMLRITYDILNTVKRFRVYEPCLKRYLFKHMKSSLLQIEPHEWETALFLPVEQFKKVKKQIVQAESVKAIKQSASQ